jgi:glycosyltransferase involved in cell wall biosynthesis
MTDALVTIGIPTFNRPELLERALNCVARQDYQNLEVIVADNGTPGDAVARLVDTFRPRIRSLVYTKHERNIGALPNFMGLLQAARGKYFMWLADDDEISDNYVAQLVALLEGHPDASCAAGHWMLMQSESAGQLMKTASFPQHSALLRALKFIWHTDDAFFYGLHRTATLRHASFPGYWWPNREVLFNWGYVLLFDSVLRGPVLLPADRSVRFINHDYTSKSYAGNTGKVTQLFQFVMRRLNVHYLYLRKAASAIGWWALAPTSAISLVALSREFVTFFAGIALRKLRRI